jgi:hypothetical protein
VGEIPSWHRIWIHAIIQFIAIGTGLNRYSSVADPGCLSRIRTFFVNPDLGSRIRILDPGSNIKKRDAKETKIFLA